MVNTTRRMQSMLSDGHSPNESASALSLNKETLHFEMLAFLNTIFPYLPKALRAFAWLIVNTKKNLTKVRFFYFHITYKEIYTIEQLAQYV